MSSQSSSKAYLICWWRWYSQSWWWIDRLGFMTCKWASHSLTRNHRLTTLIVQHFHSIYLNPEAQTLQNLLAQKYWICPFRRDVKNCLNGCLSVFRMNPETSVPLMGHLPKISLSEMKPFSAVGLLVHYGEPFALSQGRFRCAKTYKVFLRLCYSPGISSSSIIWFVSRRALRLFLPRRGRYNNIYSD